MPSAPGEATYVSANLCSSSRSSSRHLPGQSDGHGRRPSRRWLDPGRQNWFEEKCGARTDRRCCSPPRPPRTPTFLASRRCLRPRGLPRRLQPRFGSTIFVSPGHRGGNGGRPAERDQPRWSMVASLPRRLTCPASPVLRGSGPRRELGHGLLGARTDLLAFQRGETNVEAQFTPVYMTQVVPMVEGKKPRSRSTAAARSPRMGAERSANPVTPPICPSVFEDVNPDDPRRGSHLRSYRCVERE